MSIRVRPKPAHGPCERKGQTVQAPPADHPSHHTPSAQQGRTRPPAPPHPAHAAPPHTRR